jgi:hypothetical protein
MHDRIGIHRVVRETRPGYPIKQRDRIFLQHGDLKNFVGMFLPALYSPTTPEDFGTAIYLAQNNVDVWGIDQGWTLVPPGTTDYSFMQTWGLQYHVDALRSALAIAREVRWLMGGSDDRFNLLGYSSGGMTGYALLNHEAQLPKSERHVQGFVCADMTYKSSDPDWVSFWCNDVEFFRDLYNSGVYHYDFGFSFLGSLARDYPNDPSPIFPGFTNLQVAFYFAAAPLFGDTPAHYLAGEFDAFGMPMGLQYVTTEAWLDFMVSARDVESVLFLVEYEDVLCGIADSPYDDYLADVRVAVLNWGAGGGIGPYGGETLDLLGSRDTSEYIVSTWPPEDILLDFAHIDMFIAENAPELAWAALLEWIRAHR